MFKKNLAMAIYSLFIPASAAPMPTVDMGIDKGSKPIIRGKGQLRATKPKASGAAALKRAATKRNNIRKNK